jgi:hypothetical protein
MSHVPVRLGTGVFCPRWSSGRGVSLTSNVHTVPRIKNEWSWTSTFPYTFMGSTRESFLSFSLFYFTLLYFILNSTLLHFTLLYSTLLNITLLYFTLLYSTLLHFTSLHFIVLNSVLLYSALPYSTLLYSTLLYFTSCNNRTGRVFNEMLSSLLFELFQVSNPVRTHLPTTHNHFPSELKCKTCVL